MMLDHSSAAGVVRRFFFAAVSAVAILYSGIAAAQTYAYDNITIDFAGVVSWGQYGGFVGFVGGIPSGGSGQVPYACINGIAYYDQTQNNSKYWYMTFVTAKASGLHVYIDLTQDVSHNCYIASARLKT